MLAFFLDGITRVLLLQKAADWNGPATAAQRRIAGALGANLCANWPLVSEPLTEAVSHYR